MLKKVLITLMVLSLLTGAVLFIRHVNTFRDTVTKFVNVQEERVANGTLRQLSGTGFQLVQENSRLKLYVNFDDGNIQVVNKENGYIWRSCPTQEEMALDVSNALWKNNLQSAVVFTYTTSRSSTDIKYANPLAQQAKVTVYQKDTGVRVYFEFLAPKVTFGYDIALERDRLAVNIPSYLISDPGEVYKVSASGVSSLDKNASCLIVDFYLFPSLGATRSDMGSKGYLLVPDGSGALMHFDSGKFANSQFIAHVYGPDMALYNGFDQQLNTEMNKPSICFPVFGVVRDGNTLLGVIDQGETQADIVASRAGVQTGFNTAAARFSYRMKYKVVTNAATGDGYLGYTADGVQDSRRLLYYFGTGGYVEMAKAYRGYLMEKYGLKRMDDAGQALALQLYIVGGDVEIGLAGESFIPMTTFDQAKEILRYFKENGVESVDAVLAGWAKRGISVKYPDRFPAASALGGDNELNSLAAYAGELHDSIYLLDNSLSLGSHKGVRVRADAVYNIQNTPLFDGAFANAGRMAKDFADALKEYRKYGVSGIQESMVGWLLMTDYSRSSPATREQMKQAQRELLLEMNREFGGLRLDSSNAYGLMNGVTLTYLASGSYLTILDESVPFYNIALHGLADYLCGDYMDFYEPDRQLLQAVAEGGNISFSVSWEPTQKLEHANYAMFYSTQFSLWKEDILRLYTRLQDYSRKTRGSFITGYEKIGSGAVLTTYDNGVRVVVNFSANALDFKGVTVPAQDFAVLEGGGAGA